MYLAWKQGQIARAQRFAAVAAPLTAALSRESDPVPVKYALSLMNVVSPRVRLPLVELTSGTKAEIEGVLVQLAALYGDYLIGSVPLQEQKACEQRAPTLPLDPEITSAFGRSCGSSLNTERHSVRTEKTPAPPI